MATYTKTVTIKNGRFTAIAKGNPDLSADVTGTLPIANGGTGQTTALAARGSSGLNIDEMTTHGDSDYTIQSTDRVVATSAALTAARTWTLPAANSVNAGQALIVADLAGGVGSIATLGILRAGLDTINGGSSISLTGAYQWCVLISDGSSKWAATLHSSIAATGGTVTSVGSSDSSLTVTNPTTTPNVVINTAHSNSWSALQEFQYQLFGLFDTSNSKLLKFYTTETYTADRVLSITVNNASRSLIIPGDATISGTNTGDQVPSSWNLSDTYANLPAAGTAGRIFFCTDSPYVLRDTGAAWTYRYDGVTVLRPGLASASWLNQDGATLTTTYGTEDIYHAARASAHSVNARVFNTPSVPYNNGVVFGLQIPPLGLNYAFILIGWYESGTGKIQAISINAGDGTMPNYQRLTFANSTATPTFTALTVNSLTVAPARIWFKLVDDNTNRVTYYSTDRRNWIALNSVARANGFTTAPNQFLVGIDAHSADAAVRWFDYEAL